MQVMFYKVYVAFMWLFFRGIIDLNCLILNKRVAGACGNRTHPSRFWRETPALKAGRDTRTLCAPRGFTC